MYRLSLIKTAYTSGQLSGVSLPQLALAGRSNVGKSSLINLLGGRRNLAKISSTPGKTRSINFYLVEPAGFYLVDLPGYGYARCSRAEREKWGLLIHKYMEDNPFLKAVVLLLDSRLEPQVMDMELAQYVKAHNLGLIAVLTKVDKCRQKDLKNISRTWTQILGQGNEPVMVSSKTGQGRELLWSCMVKKAAC